MQYPLPTQQNVATDNAVEQDVSHTIRLRGAVFFLWEPGWPYGIGVADGRTLSRHFRPGTDYVVSFHIVTQGPCWAAVSDEPPIRLDTGDTLVLPRGDTYKIANTPQYPTPEDSAASIEFFRFMTAGDIPPVVAVGLQPIQYLTRWRMQVAANRLRDTAAKVHVVANEVGYDSEEAFSRAFKHVVGVTPREWRNRV